LVQQPSVELAVLEDARTIAVMSRDLIEYGFQWVWQEHKIQMSIVDPSTNVAVIREHDNVVGFAMMEYEEDEAHLLLLAVAPSRQRRGLGRALVAWLEHSARAAGVERIRVEARRENIAARSLYSEAGFHEQIIERGMYSSAVDGVRLEKWLRSRVPPSDA
jgi:[ribosomal protein S18]-alanine N-acetyltransferase